MQKNEDGILYYFYCWIGGPKPSKLDFFRMMIAVTDLLRRPCQFMILCLPCRDHKDKDKIVNK